MARVSPACAAALHRLEQQCATSSSRDTALLAIRAFVRFADAAEGKQRRIDTKSEAFQHRLGACPAALEVLGLCGFCPDGEDERWLELPPEAPAPPPDVVRAVEEAAEKADIGRSHITPVAQRNADPDGTRSKKASDRRCPLTKRLPTADPAQAAEGSLLAEQALMGQVGAEAAIAEALRDGGWVVCAACGAVVAVDRYEQHMLKWCPATGGGLEDSDEDDANQF